MPFPEDNPRENLLRRGNKTQSWWKHRGACPISSIQRWKREETKKKKKNNVDQSKNGHGVGVRMEMP